MTQNKQCARRARWVGAVAKATWSVLLAISGVAALSAHAAPAAYPDHAVTLVVPFPAGGPSDQLAQSLVEALRKPLGVAVQIEHIGGAGGTVGAAKVARATPDGYTLLLHHIGMATAPALYPSLAYNTLDDFEYLGLLQEVPMVLVGRPGLPAKTYAELSQWMVANRGKVNLANAGQGSASQLCGLLFRSVTQMDLRSVRYRGASPAMADLLTGQVDLMCNQSTDTALLLAKNKLRAYAVTSPQRMDVPSLTGVPTLHELGLKGFSVTVWYGVYAPHGTPKPVLEALAAALQQARGDPVFQANAKAGGASVVLDGRSQGPEHKRFVKSELSKWGAVIRAAGEFAN